MGDTGTATTRLRRLTTAVLSPSELRAVRELLVDAFGADEDERFDEDDWQHATGGVHFILDAGGEIVAHAAVVERELHVDGHPVPTGYVEAVATRPGHQGKGYGSIVMRDVGAYLADTFELGALATGRHPFYERLGWRTWQGPSSVRTPNGIRRTADEDGFLMVLQSASSPPVDLTASISCDWRSGDVW